MKKCPTCQRTFDDSLRFCQSDGTPLVDDAPPVDPYKTMVASKADISAAIGGDAPSGPETSAKADDEVLQLPVESDPKKTMFVSEEELRREMGAPEEPVVDLPPLAPEPPKFAEPDLSPPSFGDVTPAPPPPSPFSPTEEKTSQDLGGEPPPFMKTTPPIPSPFSESKGAAYDRPMSYSPPEAGSPLPADPEPASLPIQAGASAPVQNWESNEPMQNAPISAAAGQNKTLAIVSLVAGILGLTLCFASMLPSLLAIVLGFMARSKANNDPVNYGGSGLALGGIITGVVGIIIGAIALIVYFVFVASMMQFR